MTMASTRYLTLEEFLSFPTSLPTILIPRSQALRLVQLCELAEMTSSSFFLNFIFPSSTMSMGVSNDANAIGNERDGTEVFSPTALVACSKTPSSSSSSLQGSMNNTNTVHNPYILVTQMALLLYLGEYTHAHHLWNRSQTCLPTRIFTMGAEQNTAPHLSSSSYIDYDADHVQLEKLWIAAKFIHLWHTGGIQDWHNNDNGSTISNNDNDDIYSGVILSPTTNTSANEMMDVQIIEDKDDKVLSLNVNTRRDDDLLPFSTRALRSLQSCRESKMEPLATYANELLGVFRSRINERLHKYMDTLKITEFCLRMNYDIEYANDRGAGEDEEVWVAFGWKKDNRGYLVSDIKRDAVLFDEDDVDKDGIGVCDIEKLTNIVMFLEERLNA